MEAIAVELGLAARLADVGALARFSVRLTLGEREKLRIQDGSRFGGMPNIAEGVEEPDRDSHPPELLAQLNLVEVAAALGSDPQLPAGKILCFDDAAARSRASDMEPGGARLVLAAPCTAGQPGASRQIEPSRAGRVMELSTELSLPRAWSAPVRALALPRSEVDAWNKLRRRLAELQGIATVDSSRGPIAIQRFLGYPDERTGAMPLACAMLANGIELGGRSPRLHPRAGEFESEAQRWRLLLQLSRDDDLGWSWGGRRERLYLWIDERDLARGRLEEARAIVQ